MDPDPDISDIELQDANKKLIFLKKVFLLITFKGTCTSFSKKKVKKKSQSRRGFKVFITIFAW
jgi:hypothetical protein